MVLKTGDDVEIAVCAAICRSGGIRAREIARMLSGATVTEAAIANAKSLLA